MAWHYGTFSCGHDGRVNVIGPTKDRDYIAARKFEGLCPECYEKDLELRKEKAQKEALEKATEMDLPELKGSEKQVAWALTLRQKFIDKVQALSDLKYKDLKKDFIEEVFYFILENKTDSRWYIDNRYSFDIFDSLEQLLKKTSNEIKSDEDILNEKTELEIKAESTVMPENAISKVAVEIYTGEDKVTARFEKNEDFKAIVKNLKFSWENGAWERKINNLTGTAKDRSAELGNKLLNAGFPIMIMDELTRNNAISGTYVPEFNRWVMLRTGGNYKGYLNIRWWERNDRLYNIARKLPGSKWDAGAVVVKLDHYKDVQEFAEMYDFQFTEAALNAIDDYIAAMSTVEIVKPAVVKEEKSKDGLAEILASSREIIDDLKDDD